MMNKILASMISEAIPKEGNFRIAFQSGDDGNRTGTDIRVLRCEDDGTENVVFEAMLRFPKK